MQRVMIPISALIILSFVMTWVSAAEPWEKFYGEYDGEAISDTDGELGKRDVKVTIEATDKGFGVTWVVVTIRTDGKVKRKKHTVNFQPTDRENLYRSAMRTDVFGQEVPLDPIKGDPYVWGRIDGDALLVHALIIREDGGYELQIYKRSLTEYGMDLSYTRVRDGEVLRTVTAELIRR